MLPKSILLSRNQFLQFFELFGCIPLKSILAFRIDSGISEIFLLSVKITFRGTTKHKSFYLKINSTKAEPNMLVVFVVLSFACITIHLYCMMHSASFVAFYV